MRAPHLGRPVRGTMLRRWMPLHWPETRSAAARRRGKAGQACSLATALACTSRAQACVAVANRARRRTRVRRKRLSPDLAAHARRAQQRTETQRGVRSRDSRHTGRRYRAPNRAESLRRHSTRWEARGQSEPDYISGPASSGDARGLQRPRRAHRRAAPAHAPRSLHPSTQLQRVNARECAPAKS